MTIQEIFDLGIKEGTKADPRGEKGVKRWLELRKKRFEKLPESQKELARKDLLTNPYPDTAIHFGDPKKDIKTILAGIDIETGEIALIKALNKDIDLIISHHPVGVALADLSAQMHMQADLMASFGVPINVAEGVIKERIEKVRRGTNPENHYQVVDAAKMAKLPILNMHTPCDNLVFNFLQKLIDANQPETLSDLLDLLLTIPEYHQAAKMGFGPMIFAGSPENRAGRIAAFDITGGTGGAKEIYPELVKAGVGTVVGMHISEENREEAAKNHLNIVIAGHISSDSLGMNLYLDKLEEKGVEIVPIGGLIRVKRTN